MSFFRMRGGGGGGVELISEEISLKGISTSKVEVEVEVESIDKAISLALCDKYELENEK